MAAFIQAYWTVDEIGVNLVILAHIGVAFLLGTLIGYERSFHGHAAGMRTYALVATASTALVIVAAYPAHWFGSLVGSSLGADPTRIIQGVVTGIGFLCAGVIIQEGFSIRGLSTSASIWMTTAVGVIVGLGFFLAAIGATALTLLAMGWFRGIEQRLAHQENTRLTLNFRADACPDVEVLAALVGSLGYRPIETSYEIDRPEGRHTYTMVLQSAAPGRNDELVRAMLALDGLSGLHLAPSRN
jgi:putative Mg2+ transporter-C (MgtC) family protein